MKKVILFFLMTMWFPLVGICQTIVTASQVNGSWNETNNAPDGISLTFNVKALGKNRLEVQFIGNNAGRGFSNEVKGIAFIEGITAIFKPDDTQVDPEKPCVITLKFVDGTLMVTEQGDCGWGRGITAAGIYNKLISEQ